MVVDALGIPTPPEVPLALLAGLLLALPVGSALVAAPPARRAPSGLRPAALLRAE